MKAQQFVKPVQTILNTDEINLFKRSIWQNGLFVTNQYAEANEFRTRRKDTRHLVFNCQRFDGIVAKICHSLPKCGKRAVSHAGTGYEEMLFKMRKLPAKAPTEENKL